MYYKVLKNGKVIDVLDRLIYVKYQDKHKTMILCGENDAQGILDSSKNTIWHIDGLYDIPVSGYDSVILEEIDKYEYEQLKMLNGKTIDEILDAYTLLLIQEGVI